MSITVVIIIVLLGLILYGICEIIEYLKGIKELLEKQDKK